MSLKEWLVQHLPPWLNPFNRWGEKGRPEMPEMHEAVNRQQAASLRLDRALRRREQEEAAERQRYTDWRSHEHG